MSYANSIAVQLALDKSDLDSITKIRNIILECSSDEEAMSRVFSEFPYYYQVTRPQILEAFANAGANFVIPMDTTPDISVLVDVAQ